MRVGSEVSVIGEDSVLSEDTVLSEESDFRVDSESVSSVNAGSTGSGFHRRNYLECRYRRYCPDRKQRPRCSEVSVVSEDSVLSEDSDLSVDGESVLLVKEKILLPRLLMPSIVDQ